MSDFPGDWYWRKKDGSVYSSARDVEVSGDDELFRAWLDGGGRPTPYPRDAAGNESWAELMKVLAPYGLGVPNFNAYEKRGDDLYKIKFTKKEFLLWCGLENIVKLNSAIVSGNMMAKTVHDLLFAAEYIDVTDADTKQMVNLLATEASGSVLTVEEARRILDGELYEEGVGDDAA